MSLQQNKMQVTAGTQIPQEAIDAILADVQKNNSIAILAEAQKNNSINSKIADGYITDKDGKPLLNDKNLKLFFSKDSVPFPFI